MKFYKTNEIVICDQPLQVMAPEGGLKFGEHIRGLLNFVWYPKGKNRPSASGNTNLAASYVSHLAQGNPRLNEHCIVINTNNDEELNLCYIGSHEDGAGIMDEFFKDAPYKLKQRVGNMAKLNVMGAVIVDDKPLGLV